MFSNLNQSKWYLESNVVDEKNKSDSPKHLIPVSVL